MLDLGAALAAQVRQERLRLGWTQADAAAHAGISTRSYVRFEQSAQVTLTRLLNIAAAFGLHVSLTSFPAPTPPIARLTRQRGLRHRRSVAAPSPPPSPPSAHSVTAAPPTKASPAPARAKPPIDSAAVAEIAKRYRQKIQFLVRAIVFNRLTNYTTRTVTENTMNSNHVPEADRPAFVAAVEAELSALTADNSTALGIDAPTYTHWAKTWNPALGIVGVMY